MKARFAGICPKCQKPWKVGDVLTHDSRLRLSDPLVWRHKVCPKPEEEKK